MYIAVNCFNHVFCCPEVRVRSPDTLRLMLLSSLCEMLVPLFALDPDGTSTAAALKQWLDTYGHYAVLRDDMPMPPCPFVGTGKYHLVLRGASTGFFVENEDFWSGQPGSIHHKFSSWSLALATWATYCIDGTVDLSVLPDYSLLGEIKASGGPNVVAGWHLPAGRATMSIHAPPKRVAPPMATSVGGRSALRFDPINKFKQYVITAPQPHVPTAAAPITAAPTIAAPIANASNAATPTSAAPSTAEPTNAVSTSTAASTGSPMPSRVASPFVANTDVDGSIGSTLPSPDLSYDSDDDMYFNEADDVEYMRAVNEAEQMPPLAYPRPTPAAGRSRRDSLSATIESSTPTPPSSVVDDIPSATPTSGFQSPPSSDPQTMYAVVRGEEPGIYVNMNTARAALGNHPDAHMIVDDDLCALLADYLRLREGERRHHSALLSTSAEPSTMFAVVRGTEPRFYMSWVTARAALGEHVDAFMLTNSDMESIVNDYERYHAAGRCRRHI
ncbi:hypothetical protein K474DRAFT_1680728 [Panus rudis PR-1116 ss-1]|nr:hypothetical protein K474DRAFT_1680728 [Panus rudis PR-1116 ss-1]